MRVFCCYFRLEIGILRYGGGRFLFKVICGWGWSFVDF